MTEMPFFFGMGSIKCVPWGEGGGGVGVKDEEQSVTGINKESPVLWSRWRWDCGWGNTTGNK
jgi:hypothetical protein